MTVFGSLLLGQALLALFLLGMFQLPSGTTTQIQIKPNSDWSLLIAQFMQRVQLILDGTRLMLSLSSLFPANNPPVTLIRDILIRIKRRGVEMGMLIGDAAPVRLNTILLISSPECIPGITTSLRGESRRWLKSPPDMAWTRAMSAGW